jgi:hypothetical protein
MGLATCPPGASLKARAVLTMPAGGRIGRSRFSYQVATAMWKSIYFAGTAGVLVSDTGRSVVRLPRNKCSQLPARGSRPMFPME